MNEEFTDEQIIEMAENAEFARRLGYDLGPDGISDAALRDYALGFMSEFGGEWVRRRLRDSRSAQARLVAVQAQVSPCPSFLEFIETKVLPDVANVRGPVRERVSALDWLGRLLDDVESFAGPRNAPNAMEMALTLRLIAALASGVSASPDYLPLADALELADRRRRLVRLLDVPIEGEVSAEKVADWRGAGLAVLDLIRDAADREAR